LQPPIGLLARRRAASAVILWAMLRFLLLRYLPRRLVPLLVLWEAIQLVRRLRGGRPLFADDRVIEGRATRVPPAAVEPPG
jgi:hypothetical protein